MIIRRPISEILSFGACTLLLILSPIPTTTVWGFVSITQRAVREHPIRLNGWWGNDQEKNATPSLQPPSTIEKKQKKSPMQAEIDSLEKEVLYNTQAELDRQNVNRAVTSAFAKSDSSTSAQSFKQSATSSVLRNASVMAPQWSIAVAGGISLGSVVFFLTQNIVLGLATCVGIGYLGSRDPLEEEDPAGAVARTVGRYTLDSVEAAKPKARALARAALTGEEEIVALRAQLEKLERGNSLLKAQKNRLSLWKKRRMWVDDKVSSFNLQELKEQARGNKLQVGGTKAQLLMRLVEAEVIAPDLND